MKMNRKKVLLQKKAQQKVFQNFWRSMNVAVIKN